MTTIDSATAATGAAAGAQSAAQKTLAGNFDTFLTLLTTQLQNQDPMNPMDSNQFTQQLVEFSQVEQQINTNDNLKSLISLTQGRSATDAVGYLGKAVSVSNGNASLSGGAAHWNYALGAEAAKATISIQNAAGTVVYTGPADATAGAHAFDWNGKDSNGNELADGTYKMTVTATGADGSAIQTAVSSAGIVSEVDLSGSEPMLMIGNMSVPLSQVAMVGNPAAAN
jgi:flagellar basal-body rod modification protein FlgD